MKQSLKPFKIKVRYLSRTGIIRAIQEGEPWEDQIVQVWGTDVWEAANEWGIKTTRTKPVYGVFGMDGTVLFYNGGDYSIG